ncbi:MAG TPA: hypothetical protein PKM43_14880 [Verrucomicrobiota bacterium]|nr:hypothetical protein [Verrucomicrobiota bacterium]
MEQHPTTSKRSKRRGTSLGTAFFLVLALAILVIAGLAASLYYMRGEQRKSQEKLAALELKAQEAEIEQKAAAEKERLVRARNRQEEVLGQARAATNCLENLLAEIKELNAGATALRSNEDGKRVALHPDLVERARVFYEVQLRDAPAAAGAITRLENARRIEQQVHSQEGTAYEPTPDILETARNVAASAEQDRGKVTQLRTYLSALVEESKVKYTEAKLTAASPTLEDAIKAKVTAAAAAAQQTLVNQTTDAQQQAAKTMADAEAKRIVEEANQKAAKIIADAEENKAARERERILAEADQKKKDAETEDERQRKLREARMVELRRKASDPAIQSKLACFTTPGTFQVQGKRFVRIPDKKPLSWTQLSAYGALDGTMAGLQNLVEIAASDHDTDRPRWRLNLKFWSNKPETLEMVKETQQLLNELGPVLVEMKLLEP